MTTKTHNTAALSLGKDSVFRFVSAYRGELMGFAALWILIFHEWVPLAIGPNYLITGEWVLKIIGFCGADLFFFLSGMGLFQSMEKKPALGAFYYRRCRRLLVPFVIMSFFFQATKHWSAYEWLMAVTGYSFFFKNMYTLLWFGPAIAIVYLVFPLYYRVFMKQKNKYVFTALVLAVWLAASLLLANVLREDLYGFTNRIPVIVLGTLFGWVGSYGNLKYSKWSIPAFLALTGAGFVLCYLANFNHLEILVPVSNCCIPNLVLTLGLCGILPIVFHFVSGLPVNFRWLRLFGTVSFELYCVQEWLGDRILPLIEGNLPALVCDCILIPLTTLAGYGLYYLNQFLWKQVDRR